MNTPMTRQGERQYDSLDPVEALRRAWSVSGTHPTWHRAAQDVVRRAMPLVARALDRL